MRRRCNEPSRKEFKWYGGKGIKVCERWNNFQNFVDDMLPSYFEGATIERKSNNDNYTPDNCKWVTKAEQQLNRSNVFGHWKQRDLVIKLYNRGTPQRAIAEQLGMSQATVSRLVRGL